MKKLNYIPLNVKSGYSFLSSALRVEDIVNVSVNNQLDYASCIEDSNMHSFPILNSLCLENKINPIFGCNIRLKLAPEADEITISLIIKNEDGYKSLCEIINHEKTLEEINSNSSGLILVIPSLSNKHLIDLINNDENQFAKAIFNLSKSFTDVFIGIEYYQKNDKEIVNKFRNFADTHNYKKVLFSKHLYVNKNDALSLNILSSIKENQKIDSKDEINGPYYFLGNHAVNTLYTKDEINNTFEISKSINFTLTKKRGSLLQYPFNSDLPIKKFLYFLCLQNARERQISLNQDYLTRLEYEIDVIDKMGYCSYFLIVQDYVNYAKKSNIPVGPGRGSAAGSLVSYLLGITEVNPIKYDLFFERFLNPERVTMPDIDIDIADYARQDVIDYIYRKYGKNRMANIITFQNIGAKQSLRDIGRVFSINNSDINHICSLIKNSNMSLKQSIESSKDLSDLYKDQYFKRIINLAMKIEGLPRQESLHAAGIILNQDDLTQVLPTSTGPDGKLISQFEASYLENLGFLKMDILGLRNLSIMSYCEKQIKSFFPYFSLNKVNYEDEKTFNIINAGLTQGIFQLEGEGITNAAKKIKIQSFNDLVALLALYRPGPIDNIPLYASRKNANQKVDYIHPLIEDILKPTFGIIIYQEQIMQIVQRISNFSLSEADLFRRAISKKDASKLEDLKKKFIDGALKNNIDLNSAENIFSLIDKFANYGFNKSHSVSYALITYYLAYMKANYPTHFLSTMLTFQSNADNKYAKFKHDFNLFQIKLTLPNINSSNLSYQAKDNQILLPLNAIKGLPTNICEAIIHERDTNSKYKSIEDFFVRTISYGLNENHYLSLINSGALDIFKYNRNQLRNSLKTLIQYANATSSAINLLSESDLERFKPRIDICEVDKRLDLELELATLGVIISGSLFDKYSTFIKDNHIQSIFYSSSSSAQVNIGVIISKVKEIMTKNGNKMVIMYGFDDTQEIEIVAFSNVYQECQSLIKEKNALLIRGYFRKDEEFGISFIANYLKQMEENK